MFCSWISPSYMLDVVVSNHHFPLLNVSHLKEFYAIIAGSYLLLYLLRLVNWLRQEISQELFLKSSRCFLIRSTLEVVSLHMNWKVCHRRNCLREPGKHAVLCQRKYTVFSENLGSKLFLFIGIANTIHTGQSFIYLFNIFFHGKS